MRVLIAPDSFKESLSAADAADAMAAGVRDVWPAAEVLLRPLADGGEGFTETVAQAWEAEGRPLEWLAAKVAGPLASVRETARVRARYAVSGRRAVLESATAIGLGLVPPELRDPLRSTSFGVGELVRAALDDGATEVVLGIGGTATVDGGAGLLAALGARLLDADGRDVEPVPAGLSSVLRVDLTALDPRLKSARLRVACDVTSPLLGPGGAARVFGPQKGADPAAVDALEEALSHWSGLLDPDATLRERPGAGAAGGLGFALLLLGATLEPGADLVADLLALDQAIAWADVVLTGEGSLDAQTLAGKGPGLVARRAHAAGRAVVGFAGRIGTDPEALEGVGFQHAVASTQPATPLAEALREAAPSLRAAVARSLPIAVLRRRYEPRDAAATLEVFRAAVRGTAARDYDAEQIAAWAPEDTDPRAWSARRASAHTVVAFLDDRLVGFADLRDDDEPLLDMLFVHPDAAGRGVARALVTDVLTEARARGHRRVVTHGSRTARPALERLGFVVDAERDPNWIRGVNVPNYELHIDLG